MLKKTSVTRRGLLCYAFLLFVCLFSFSCDSRLDAPSFPRDAGASRADSGTFIRAGDFAAGQLEAHYLKHGYQFGTISQGQYLENARMLLNAPVGGDVYGKTRLNGDILRYRASTGEFAAMNMRGRIRTYFKTDYRYWMRQ